MEQRRQARFTAQFRSTFSGGQREGQGWTLDLSTGGCKIGTDLLARRCSLMTDRADPFETIARPLIQQCRREIGAAWVQIEAAREGLRRSRWLLAVWEEQRRKGDVYWKTRPDLSGRSEAARIGMFVPSHAPFPPRRRVAPW